MPFVETRPGVEATMDSMMAPIRAFAYILCTMIMTLSFFMMTVSFSQKVRDLAYEQGVLRAVGLTKEQSTSIFYYEATSIVVASMLTGTAAGMLTALLISSLFAEFVETERHTIIPVQEICFTLGIIILGTYLAVRLPAREINQRQVSSVLKGQGN